MSKRPVAPVDRSVGCRFAALVASITFLLLTVGVPPPAAAIEPFDLPDQITDQVGALEGRRAEVQAAFDDLEAAHDVRMWVVFVDSFDGYGGQSWADGAFAASGLGARDYLFAVAMGDREYGYVVDDAFVLSDAALAEVAAAAERHLAENPARAVTEAASTLGHEVSQGASRGSDTAVGDAVSGWAVLGVALLVIVGVLGIGGLVLYLALNGTGQRPGPGDAPPDTAGSGSSWWTDTSDSTTGGWGGWSGGGDGGGGTRGGSGSF